MTLLILGLVLWWATHLFKILAPGPRAALDARIGAGPAKGAIALGSLAAIALMVIGYQRADFVNLWFPPAFMIHINNLLMLIAVFVFIAKDFRSGVRLRVRHPQLSGVKIWAFAHLLVNGDLASVVLFGGLLAWAVVAMIGSNRRDGPDWVRPAPATAKGWAFHVIATVVVFAIIAMLHLWAGLSPLPGGGA